MRAVALPEVPNPTWAVILDMPLSTTIEQRIQQETGIRMGEITALLARGVQPVLGRAIEDRPLDDDDGPTAVVAPGALGRVPRSRRLADRRAGERFGAAS